MRTGEALNILSLLKVGTGVLIPLALAAVVGWKILWPNVQLWWKSRQLASCEETLNITAAEIKQCQADKTVLRESKTAHAELPAQINKAEAAQRKAAGQALVRERKAAAARRSAIAADPDVSPEALTTWFEGRFP